MIFTPSSAIGGLPVMRMQAASVRQRLAAKSGDVVYGFLAVVLGLGLASVIIVAVYDDDRPPGGGGYLLACVSVVVMFGYSLLNLTVAGSFGKRAEGLRILDQAGSDAAFRLRLFRWCIHYGTSLVAFPTLALIACTMEERYLHAASSLVFCGSFVDSVISFSLVVGTRRSTADWLSGTFVGAISEDTQAIAPAFEVIPMARPMPVEPVVASGVGDQTS